MPVESRSFIYSVYTTLPYAPLIGHV